MGLSFAAKLRIFLKIVRIVKNWHYFIVAYLKLTTKEHVVLELKNGLKIQLRVNSTDLIAFTHVWILEEYNRPGFEISDSDTIIDIGGHIGLFALYASQFCKKGMIHCFEPVKENFKMLLTNIRLNKLENVFAENLAVSRNDGHVTIYINNDESGHSIHIPSDNAIESESISLNTIFQKKKISVCNYLKIDCEGEEYEIIDSLDDKYFDNIEKICIEYHFIDEKPELLKSLVTRLKSFSFSISTRDISKSIGFLYARK